jgi:hypothetical protein
MPPAIKAGAKLAERIKFGPHRSARGEKVEKSLSPTHRRTELSLVALPPFPDLFSHAKDLFVECTFSDIPTAAGGR